MKTTLIPAANPSAELAEILNTKIPSDMVADALFRALTATQTTRAGTVEADTRSQLQAASLILAYKVGRPVERQEIKSEIVNSDSNVVMRLLQSPAMRAALRQALDQAEKGDSPPALDVDKTCDA